MTTLSAFRPLKDPEPIKPARVEVLQPTDFADSWQHRPSAAVAVGLRRLSEAEEQAAVAEATKDASEAAARWPDVKRYHDEDGEVWHITRFEHFTHTFNESLMTIGVGRALCDPNDVNKPSSAIPMAEDMLRHAVRRATLARLWHALEAVAAETSAIYREASDDDVGRLCLALAEDGLNRLIPTHARRARRFLALVLDDIEEPVEAVEAG